MQEPIYFEPEDFCSHCQKQHTIELYNTYNKEIGYSLLLQMPDKIEGILNRNVLSHFKCNRCGTVYGIDWSFRNNWFPVPFKENYLMQNFENYFLKKEGK